MIFFLHVSEAELIQIVNDKTCIQLFTFIWGRDKINKKIQMNLLKEIFCKFNEIELKYEFNRVKIKYV